MILKLTEPAGLTTCPVCDGSGRIPCPQTVATRTIGFNGVPALQPSTGHPIPCPRCKGKRLVGNLSLEKTPTQTTRTLIEAGRSKP